MKTLPELNDDAVIELAREGGIAWIPKLAGLRRFALANLPPPVRERICHAIRSALPQAREPGGPDSPGRGDQFYYRIHIYFSSAKKTPDAEKEFLIPENLAPPELTTLWREGK
ncbi:MULTISPECIES: protealysin inhibitor emfourin [unclassified Brenneria]|uniref:protealysin inhibitor emfourin n=1 Tax=unclassified Brenneria TaxID=2634434 RepID=UPI0029C32991|nr:MULTISPECIES: protealysin inhibitor emfourin [unclassified Brenneria]MDX5629597.1 protealysin inhibitor emfourin [Brenneria sp. L3-3Z]MDX5696743.1 protealysin inhibitor emfourin [Brenneria sp. L4-2C]MEE3663147.1 protealysin inhibitor emfourin [Brenneria sp. g21c3]